ncbi:MAG: cache domain-containing protein [Cellvibrionaceae bacterium]
MGQLSFKSKILLLTLLPLIVVSVLIISLAAYQAKQLGDKNVSNFSEKIYELRKIELKNYTNIAKTAVKHLDKVDNKDSLLLQEEIKEIIRNMSYGKDGYFFAYDKYTTLAHPKVRKLEGNDQRDMTDPNGVKIIEQLYARARQGGGYTSYVWLKPSREREVEKIGFSDKLDGLDWWIGTGLYVDDLEDAVINIQTSVDENIQTTLQLIISLAVGAVIVVGFIGARLTLSEGKLADEKLQQLSRKAVGVQEDERRRVALDLQKNISQALTAIRYKLKNVYEAEPPKEQKTINHFSTAVTVLNKTIKEVYRISGELRPETLDKMGLYAAVGALTDKASAESTTRFIFKEVHSKERLSSEVETALYRITQEAINNILKHSEADEATIRIRQAGSSLTLNIQDNGIGFDTKKINNSASGVGFVDMRVRAESLRGSFFVFSSPGTGTAIKVSIPLD